MIIIAQGNIDLTRTCGIYTVGSVIQIMLDEEDGLDISFGSDKKAKAALQAIKEEIKRQSSSCRCEVVIDVDEIRERIEAEGNKHE
nr:MAG TPA: Pcc1, Gon7, binary complex, Gon7-Pcc1, tRNA.44A [Caudoviricetes sp.]